MKKIKFVLLLLVATTFGCTKSHDLNTENGIDKISTQSNQNILSEIKSITSPEAQKIAYNQLPAAIKATIWKEHLSAYLSSKTLAESKIALIKELSNTLSESVFYSKENAVNYLSSDNVTIILYKIKKSFSSDEIFRIFGSLNKSVNTNAAGGGNTCNCSSSSDFCEGSNIKCFKKLWDCSDSQIGCGWFFLQSCDGLCGIL